MAKKDKEPPKKIDLSDIKGLCDLIDKKFGDNTVMVGEGAIVAVDHFPSGISSLDNALGCGGIPQGRIIEIFGPESSGKTTTCLQIMAACQKHHFKDLDHYPNKDRTGVVMFIDAEHAFDPEWATSLGVDINTLLFSQPSSGEEALDIAEMTAKSGLVDLIVIDSVAALTPKAVLEGTMDDNSIGALPRMLTKGVNKLTPACSETGTSIIFINQMREKIGVMFGSNESTPGGRALKHGASVRIDVRRVGFLKEGETNCGITTKAKICKNKVARPNTECTFNIMFGGERDVVGIDRVADITALGLALGVIKMAGAQVTYKDTGELIGKGYAGAYAALDDPAAFAKLDAAIRAFVSSSVVSSNEPAAISD